MMSEMRHRKRFEEVRRKAEKKLSVVVVVGDMKEVLKQGWVKTDVNLPGLGRSSTHSTDDAGGSSKPRKISRASSTHGCTSHNFGKQNAKTRHKERASWDRPLLCKPKGR